MRGEGQEAGSEGALLVGLPLFPLGTVDDWPGACTRPRWERRAVSADSASFRPLAHLIRQGEAQSQAGRLA